MRTQLNDFKKTDGSIDWNAHDKARQAAGESCSQCRAFIIFAKGHPTFCTDCENLQRSNHEVTHHSLIRCPGCGTTRVVEDLFQEGEHSVCCWNCELDFTVVCEVSYSFRSPERIPKDKVEEDDCVSE